MLPKRLLIHSVSVYSIAKDDYGSETETLVSQLQRVRIEPCEEMVSGANGEDVRCSASLFVDSSEGTVPDVDMVVKWTVGGSTKRYRVMRIDRLYDAVGLSHYEVKLSDG